MAELVFKEATYEELEKVPPNRIAEIIDGHLVTQPRPAPKHAWASSALTMQVGGAFHQGHGGPGGWIILDEPELHLGKHVLVPDLAGWRRETLPKLPETAYFETPPDWICEVISPSTARYDRIEKRRIYAEFKVSHLWFIDPDAQTLEAFELRKNDWLLIASHAGKDEISVAPFAEVPFSLGVLWEG